MRLLRILLAGVSGFLVDSFLTSMVLVIGVPFLGLQDANQMQLDFDHPAQLVVLLILPMLMTVIGGALAGALAPLDAQPAGALVGGLGLIELAILGTGQSTNDLVGIIGQCVATILAAVAAVLMARYRMRTGR